MLSAGVDVPVSVRLDWMLAFIFVAENNPEPLAVFRLQINFSIKKKCKIRT